MKKYKIISFDIYQTLVDVNQRIPLIWQDILQGDYTEEKARQGAGAVLDAYPEVYRKVTGGDNFFSMEEVFLECTKNAMSRLDFYASPETVTYHLMRHHSKAPFYREVQDCLEQLRQQYRIILSSDSGHVMVDDLVQNIDCEKVFISDDMKSYKGDRNGKFFNAVLSQMDANPQDILHVGDSAADIYGAQKAGITGCWLNREGVEWTGTSRPDYTIRDLNGLLDILGNVPC